MSETPRYPTFSDASLVPFRAIDAQLKQYPDLLDRSDCPYPPHVKTLLRRLVGEPGAAPVPEQPLDDDDLVTETSTLYRSIKTAGETMKSSDPKDQMAIFKTSADLLSKLVTLREKAQSVRQMSQFQRAVIEVLEQVITPAQRSEFIEKLGKFINVQ
jgi:hypothetical protein